MADDGPDRTGEPGLGLLLGRVLGVAALVIAASAALFLGLGRVGGDDLVVADGPTGEAADDEAEDEAAAGPDGDVEDNGQDPDDGADAATEPDDQEGADAEPDAADDAEDTEPEGGAEDADDGDGDDAESSDEGGSEGPAIAPADISVQVLDGFQQDGGAAAAAVADQLADEGYRIIARNPARAYEVTTVLWTSGHEDAARQVAEAIDAGEVREQPGNLSDQVMVHVVVGSDRG